MLSAIVLASALNCLTANIYHEARNQPVLGQQAVALVTWNRAERDASKICSVVKAPSQFSWVKGVAKKRGKTLVIPLPDDQKAWAVATLVAKQALNNKIPDFLNGATFYHATYVAPKWRLGMTRMAVLGDHIFYKAA